MLTAAHCLTFSHTKGIRTGRILLGFGKFHRLITTTLDQHSQFRTASHIEINEFYNAIRLGSDVAVIWLNQSLQLNEYVSPICLPGPRHGDVGAGDLGTLVGWGRTAHAKQAQQLQEVRLPIVSPYACQTAHQLERLVYSETFCAGYRNRTSACDGDSGGGLVFEHNGNWVIHGIVSAGVSLRDGCSSQYYTILYAQNSIHIT